jgi:deoxyribodipyrimidine photolyase-related protein
MSAATILYPHQLYPSKSAAFSKSRPVYLVEEALFLTEFPTHRQKLLLHRLSLKAYAQELKKAGYSVTYLDVREYPNTEAVFAKLASDGVTELHLPDTTDDWLEKRIKEYTEKYQLTRVRYPSEIFFLKEGYKERYTASKKHLAAFYKKMRKDFCVLMETDGSPTGGEWSFDSENRKKLPKDLPLPADITYIQGDEINAAQAWLEDLPGEHYGEDAVWVPYTRAGAQKYLKEFLVERFAEFGPYEDAIHTNHCRLFHSTLSPLINIGLLTPEEVLTAAISYSKKHEVPTASLEGFVRQILGWREFIRAAYEVDGREMRTANFFKHTRSLPAAFWDSTTGIEPIDTAIKGALKFGYTHHIERLMVLGNFMLLTKTNPDEVYRWFMAMYVDAYDWVMVPNVYGMSQFADGGIFATKPYISGSNYLKKMSNYSSGEWEELWTALYWNFIAEHQEVFLRNHRLSMMPRLLINMQTEKRVAYLKKAAKYLKQTT